MTLASDPSVVAPLLFGPSEEVSGVVEDLGLAAKLSRISGEVARRLGNLSEEARSAIDSELGEETAQLVLPPWTQGECRENAVQRWEAEYYANDRVIATLVTHLVQHIVLGANLRAMAEDARRGVIDELGELPKFMVEFSNRLMAAGIGYDDVKNMSRHRLEAVIRAIRGADAVGAVELADEPEDNIRRRAELPVDEEGGSAPANGPDSQDLMLGESSGEVGVDGNEERSGPSGEEVAADQLRLSETPSDETSVPVQPEPLAAPQPAGPWDVLDLGDLPYRVIERPADSDETMAALRFRYPTISSLMDVAVSTTERSMAEAAENYIDIESGIYLLDRWCKRDAVDLTDEEKMLWVFLLAVLRSPAKAAMRVQPGRFHGLLLPGVTGSPRVRQLVSTDRSEAVMRRAFRRDVPA